MAKHQDLAFGVLNRFANTLLLAILLTAICLALVSTPGYAQRVWTFEGRVFEGKVGDENQPLQGVSVYGANNPFPDPGVLITSTTTNEFGWYGLEAPEGYEYYSIRETDPPSYTSVGATAVSGRFRTSNWIEYVIPLEEKTLTGNKFWDRGTVPSPLPEVEPDLMILSIDYWFEDDRRILVIYVEIGNQGNAGASETLVYAREAVYGQPERESPVPALGPEDTTRVELWMEIPDELRGTTHMFMVEVDPEGVIREFDEENNIAMTPEIFIPMLEEPRRPLPEAEPELPWDWIIPILLLGLGVGFFLFISKGKLKERIKRPPKIQISPQKDIGTQQIESDTPIQVDFEVRLRSVLDLGKQDIEAEGSLIIDERREHE